MTNEEAARNLDTMWKMLTSAYDEISDSFVLAYSMAVDALKAQMVKSDDLKAESAQNVQNGDLISRKLAIDAVRSYYDEQYALCDSIEELIEKLPSAQPDMSEYSSKLWRIAYERGKSDAQPEIIRCKDCKNWDTTWHGNWAGKGYYCPNIDSIREGDFYCADAERRADD